jgi:diguanylate cyclase (GGDEF)-like protein
MSWKLLRLAGAYGVPALTAVALVTWWPASGPWGVVASAALVGVWQGLLLRAHLRAERSARLDPLTGLPGRALLVDRMRRALAGPIEVGLAFVDLDRFKAVNDTYGHATGDRVLIETAHRLRQLAPAGAVVARYGGDEFAVLVPTGTSEIDTVARRIVGALPHPASVGTAQSTGGSVDDMLAAADQAMYRAKRTATGIWTPVPNSETPLVLP